MASSMKRQESRVGAFLCASLALLAAIGPGDATGGARVAAAATSQEALAAGAGAGNGGGSRTRQSYFGTYIGNLAPGGHGGHGLSGEVYAVDEQTLFLRNFNYDGLAPDAYFWSSTTQAAPAAQDGFIVPDEKGSTKPLERYVNKDVVLRLPEGKTLREIGWLSVWSRALRTSVGSIVLPRSGSLAIPRPLEMGPLSQLAHGLRSGPITIVDAQTLLVPDFHYDGLGPDAYFWLTRGISGLASANSLKLKDENGNSGPLRKYAGETIVVSLPDEFTIYDFDFFGVWCRQFAANFGQVSLPRLDTARVPPSPKMLGIKPENKLNCEILYDDLGFEIRWVLDGDDIVMQLVGKIEPGEYMAFGLGKDDAKSDMSGADAAVAWVDRPTGQVHAVDYYLGPSRAQCANDPKQGACPDTKLANGSDSLTLLHGAIVNGYSMVTFKRPQLGVDELYDQHVYSDGQQSVIWAVGTLNKLGEIGYHRLRTKANMFIDFARNPQWNCPIPDLNASMHSSSGGGGSSTGSGLSITSAASQVDQTVVSAASGRRQQQQQQREQPQTEGQPAPPDEPAGQGDALQDAGEGAQLQPWFIPQVVCPQDRTFHAQIGPTAGKRGYAAHTGRTSWIPPVSWYINGLLVPELVVERNQAYQFIVEGGNDKTSASRRHPLYLTDSPEGGFNFKTDDERLRERIFAGVAMRASDGQFVPTAEGRLCEWKPTNATLADPDLYATFSSYQRSLKLDCRAGAASVLKFAPDASTPDQLYYQCYTNRFMGWRVRVVDSCRDYIGAQLGQLRAQQAAAAAAASSAFASASASSNTQQNFRRDLGAAAPASNAARGRDTLDRRQSVGSTALDLIDLRAQASEQRMLAFEAPPPAQQLQNLLGGPEPGVQQHELDELSAQMQAASAAPAGWSGPGDFGDEFAASDEFQRQHPQQRDLEPLQLLLLNNASLLRTEPLGQAGGPAQVAGLNLSTLEQILRLSPSDLEFLDESQIDLAGAVALAASSQAPQSPVPIPLQSFLQATSQRPAGAANATTRQSALRGAAKVPKSLHAYMRRLASIYQPMQQQLASMLSLQSATAATQQQQQQQQAAAASAAADKQRQQEQQRQKLLAALHQQIVASSTVVPPMISRPNQEASGGGSGAASGEQATAASAPSSSFSLASLMPKSKIDLSKSNLSKKLSKLRIKSGRKYEPQQQHQQQQQQAGGQAKQQRPPAPDNEFNYDIFNNQLAQLEKQQQQLQSMENFANAMAAASHYSQWPLQGQAQAHLHDASFNYSPLMGQAQGASAADPEHSLVFSSAGRHESAPQQQQQDPLQQQQQVLNFDILKSFAPPSQGPAGQQDQQAVFVTKLPQQTVEVAAGQQQQQQQQERPQTGLRQQQEPAQQQLQQTRPHPSYLDSTDYSVQRAHSSRSQAQADEQAAEVPSGADGTHHYLMRPQQPQPQQQAQSHVASELNAPGELDHMLAIERYSKQPSERVHEHLNRSHAPPAPFSAKLIYNHLVEPTPPSSGPGPLAASSPSERHQVIQAEILDAEQSADLKRVVTPAGHPHEQHEHRAPHQAREPHEQLEPLEQRAPVASSAAAAAAAARPSAITTTTNVPPVLAGPPRTSTTNAGEYFGAAATPPTTPLSILRLTSAPSGGGGGGGATTTFQPAREAGTTPAYAPGPLVPSLGPPLGPPPASSLATDDGELVFKSNLIEPIKSTLVPTPASNLLYASSTPTTADAAYNFRPLPMVGPSRLNLDSSPFTPIEFAAGPAPHLAHAASNLLATRLRPPPFIESMLSQWAEAGRPEPPVRVASLLTEQLGQRSSSHLSSVQQVSSGAPSHHHQHHNQQQQRQQSQQQQQQAESTVKPDLIILRPAVLPAAGPSQPRTFGLRPQYLTTTAEAGQTDAPGGTPPGAGHQFDRLSSLSSPPSTSMVRTDPMQAEHSEPSQHFRPVAGAGGGWPQSAGANSSAATGEQRQSLQQPQPHEAAAQKSESLKQKLPVKVPSVVSPTAQQSDSRTGRAGASDEFNILQRDNSTDNAILTHVMSLIAAHAMPTPPLVPLASAYSSADYFLPAAADRSLAPGHTSSLFGPSHAFRVRSS